MQWGYNVGRKWMNFLAIRLNRNSSTTTIPRNTALAMEIVNPELVCLQCWTNHTIVTFFRYLNHSRNSFELSLIWTVAFFYGLIFCNLSLYQCALNSSSFWLAITVFMTQYLWKWSKLTKQIVPHFLIYGVLASTCHRPLGFTPSKTRVFTSIHQISLHIHLYAVAFPLWPDPLRRTFCEACWVELGG